MDQLFFAPWQIQFSTVWIWAAVNAVPSRGILLLLPQTFEPINLSIK